MAKAYFKVSKYNKNFVPCTLNTDTTVRWQEAALMYCNDPSDANYKRMMQAYGYVRKELINELKEGE